MCRRAFTLIEVMVVLSILAIIAILAYNFFGSTMKEAVTKQGAVQVYKELLELANSIEYYRLENKGADPPANLYHSNDGTLQASFVADHMKAIPTVPDHLAVSGCWSGTQDYKVSVNWQNIPGSPSVTGDTFAELTCLKENVAIKFNELYSSNLGATIWTLSDHGNDQPAATEKNYCYRVNDTWAGAVCVVALEFN